MRTWKKVWIPVFAQIDLKNCTIKIKDGDSNEIEVKIGEGNLTYSEARNVQYTLDRGVLDEVRLGDEVPMDVKLDFTWTYLKGSPGGSGNTPSIEETMKKTGDASDWTSTDDDECRPYAVDIELTNAPTPAACGDKEVILLADFRWEKMDHDARAGTVSVSGKCNVTTASINRSEQSS